ncbi:hypothetical protein [Phormidium nigroviride]
MELAGTTLQIKWEFSAILVGSDRLDAVIKRMNRFIIAFGQVRSCWGVQVMRAIDIQPWLFRVEPFRQDWDNALTLPPLSPIEPI